MPIFDQGYQHWSGELVGHRWRWLAITRHGVRIGLKNRLVRITLLLSWLPAIGLAFGLCVWGLMEQKSPLAAPFLSMLSFLGPEILDDPRAYRVEIWTLCFEYFLLTELRLSMFLVLLVGPSLISRDLRLNALPLYFSRPLRRIDYFLGKLGVVVTFLGLVLIVPSLIAYGLGLLFSLDLSIVRDTFPLLLACLGYGAVMSVSAGLLILALSSLSRNSRHVGLFWMAVWFVSSLIGTVLEGVNRDQRMQETYHRTAVEAQARAAAPPPKTQAERQRQVTAQAEAQRHFWSEVQREEREAARADWRPLVSYTGNLSRLGRHWLGTDACWERLAATVPADERDRFLLENLGPRYPWYWSAAVLAGLMGVSAWVLNVRVRSLDRLK